MIGLSKKLTLAVLAMTVIAGAASAQNITPSGGQVNINGATLFENFFRAAAATNDWIDADSNGIYGFDSNSFALQQLATTYTGSAISPVWAVTYRGVGSGNGLAALDTWYKAAPTYTDSADPGITNRYQWSPNAGGTKVNNVPSTIITAGPADIAVMDVPTTWFVQNTSAAGAWSKKPTQAGYGTNAAVSTTGQSQKIKTLTNLTTTPGQYDASDPTQPISVYDTPITFVPMAIIANRGTGLENVTQAELQSLFVTGRMPNGENLVAATRDSGSGTRNGSMNSIGVDPSYGVGDNVGAKEKDSGLDALGPDHKVNNMSSSSRMVARLANNRMAVGYQGLEGKGAVGQNSGKFEILNVKMTGDANYVRPGVQTILDAEYRIGGPETMATAGNPFADSTDGDTDGYAWDASTNTVAASGTDQPMKNVEAAKYIMNIVQSLRDFSGSPGADEQGNMPGEYLAKNFFPTDALTKAPNLTDPTSWATNSTFNQNLYDYIAANNNLGLGVDGSGNPIPLAGYGTVNAAGHVPARKALTGGATYSDGTTGAYYIDANSDQVASGDLAARNALMGDFKYDSVRDAYDVEKMISAVKNPRGFEAGTNHGGAAGSQNGDYVIVEVIGDFNGDGDFDAEDVRYFADGLAMVDENFSTTVNGTTVENSADKSSQFGKWLDRKVGFTLVDLADAASNGTGNYFGTTKANGTYAAGDSRADIAGSVAGPSIGAAPTGADNVINGYDISYLQQNIHSTTDLTDIDQAVGTDGSCDLNDDLAVSDADLQEMFGILETVMGDANLDGQVDLQDLTTLKGNFGTGTYWGEADLNGDGQVDLQDLTTLKGNFGSSYSDESVTPIPEPTTMLLVGLGGAAAVIRRRRK